LHQPGGLVPAELNRIVSMFLTTPHDAKFSRLVCNQQNKSLKDARTFLSFLEIINISFAI